MLATQAEASALGRSQRNVPRCTWRDMRRPELFLWSLSLAITEPNLGQVDKLSALELTRSQKVCAKKAPLAKKLLWSFSAAFKFACLFRSCTIPETALHFLPPPWPFHLAVVVCSLDLSPAGCRPWFHSTVNCWEGCTNLGPKSNPKHHFFLMNLPHDRNIPNSQDGCPAKVDDFDIQHGLQKIQDGAFFLCLTTWILQTSTKTLLLVSKPPFSAHLRQEVIFYVQDSSWYQKHHSSKASKPVAFLFHGKLSFALWCSDVSLLLVVASQVAIPHLQYHQAHEGNTGVFFPWLSSLGSFSQTLYHLWIASQNGTFLGNVAMFEGVPTMRSNAWRIRRFSKPCNLIGEGMRTHILLNALPGVIQQSDRVTQVQIQKKHLPRRFLCRGAGSFSWRVTRRTSCQAPRLENHFLALLWIFGNKLWPLGSGFKSLTLFIVSLHLT